MKLYPKQEIVAMLLAGGHGSRLGALTKKIAKPAVAYGGKYRIIDFPLSNCVNSGIEAVGVLTQYQPLTLNEYIGSGQPWDLDSTYTGIQILSPYENKVDSSWYSGTANSVYQNFNYIERYNPEYVLVISGDHIYKMDYSKMLCFHKENKADCTIATIEVPLCEAHRFGILNTNQDNSIYEFDEKPEYPKGNKASMGIYIFNWEKLKTYLEKDNKNSSSTHDFGRDVLPYMLSCGESMYAYPFNGYWKDVGTVESLWQANMDLLNSKTDMNLNDDSWKIYSRNSILPPHYISGSASVENCLVADGCMIYGNIKNSVIFTGAYIGKNADIQNSVIMPDCVVEDNVKLDYTVVSENTTVSKNTIIPNSLKPLNNAQKLNISIIDQSNNSNDNIK